MVPPVVFRGLVSVVFVVLVLAAVVPASQAYAPPTAEEMHVAVLAREEAVRLELGGDDPAAAASAVRGVVAEYREIVRVHPTSGYSDNALWQGANLALMAYQRSGEAVDRQRGTRLLRQLRAGYPSSSLLPRVDEVMAAFEAPMVTSSRRSSSA